MIIKIGQKGHAEATVLPEMTAEVVGSGTLAVLSTPYMVALMEKAAAESIAPLLDEGQTSVGTRLDITHDAATPVRMSIHAESVVTTVDGRRVVFSVTAFDETGPIGKGTHERVIVQSSRFVEKTYAKRSQ